MGQIYNDNDAVRSALAGADSLEYTESGDSTGMDPEISGALDEGNRDNDAEVDAAKDDAKKTRDGSDDLDDTDKKNGSDIGDVGTELSSGEGGGTGAGGLSAPSSGAGGGMPQQPPMQPMQMPQMSPPQMPQMPQAPQGMFQMPQQMFKDLAANMKPSSELSGSGGSGGGDSAPSGGSVSKADKLAPGDVRFDKTGHRVLTDSQLKATIDKALDLNGVSKDESIRSKWREVYTFMAEHESSRNPDAVNLTDSNARNYPSGPWAGVRASDGHPSMCSRGIWQTIPSTFADNHVAGTSTNIYDPVASAASSIRYVMNTYHVGADGTNLQAFYAKRMQGGYTGY